MTSALTAERLREVLDYDPSTGVFKSNGGRCGSRVGATLVGTVRPDGYREIRIDWQRYLAHRLAWLHVHGSWPAGDIDHVNGNPSDNRIVNLRLATRTQNNANSRRRPNTSGFKGVHFCRERNR